jgi:SOS-response transcriptional repressor LexA
MGDDTAYLAELQDYFARHQALPSYARIGELTGLRSKSTVSALVARLKLHGFLEFTPDKRLKPGARFFERYLAESVRAGHPNPVSDDPPGALTIDNFLIDKPSQTVLVRVKGDSMEGAGILNGDIAVVERRGSANVGDIVVAVVDQDFTLKYLDRDRAGYYLRPANPAYPNIRAKGALELFGVMVGLIRRHA